MTVLQADSRFHVLSVLKCFLTSEEMLKALAFPTENTKPHHSENCRQKDQGGVCRGLKSHVHVFLHLGAWQSEIIFFVFYPVFPLSIYKFKKPGIMKCVHKTEAEVSRNTFLLCGGSSELPHASFLSPSRLSSLGRPGSQRYPWMFREIIGGRRLWCAHLPKMSHHHHFCCFTLNMKDSLKA